MVINILFLMSYPGDYRHPRPVVLRLAGEGTDIKPLDSRRYRGVCHHSIVYVGGRLSLTIQGLIAFMPGRWWAWL